MKDHIWLAELNLMLSYWTSDDHSRVIASDSYKVAFSCATDAVIDREFAMARLFIRTGAFVRLCATKGNQAVAHMLRELVPGEAVVEMMECMRKTSTDRGCVLYLSKQNTCQCLSLHAKEAKSQPSTGLCGKCQEQKPKQELKRCGQCRAEWYCDAKCQAADWREHKKRCSPA